MPPEQKRTTRRGFITTTTTAGMALYLAACGGSSSSSSSSAGGASSSAATSSAAASSSRGRSPSTTSSSSRPGYSAADLAGMTKLFEQANPNIKVNNTLVAYEALHDKIVAAAPAGTYDVVLGDCIWPAEFGSKGIVKDISSDVNSLPTEPDLPRRAGDGRLQEQVLRDAVDPGHQVHVRQRVDAQEGRSVAGLAEDLERRRGRAQADQGQGPGQVPVAGELVPGRGGGLRLRAAARAPSAASSWTARASPRSSPAAACRRWSS